MLFAVLSFPHIATSKTDLVAQFHPCFFGEECTPQEYAEEKVERMFGEGAFYAFNAIVEKESKWLATAQNPHSTAYGIGQFLDSTWGLVGYKKTSDPYEQIDAMVEYIRAMYGTPQQALRQHMTHNWY